jgi:hypothetical protein
MSRELAPDLRSDVRNECNVVELLVERFAMK